MDRLPRINLLSGICSSLVLVMAVIIGINRPKRITRVSLRLQAAIAFINMARSFQASRNFKTSDSICNFIGFVTLLNDHTYLFLNVAIAANLHRVQLKSQQPSSWWEPCLWAAAFLSPIIINGLAFAAGVFGRTSLNTCAIPSSTTLRLSAKIILQYLIIFPCILYCLLISLCVLFRREPPGLRAFPSARRAACIVAIVPIVCVLTLTASLVNELALDFSSDPIPLLKYITYVLSNSAGVLGLITFVFDPGFLYAFGRYRYFEFELKSKGDPFQTITPPNPTDLISVTSIDPIAFDQYRKCKNLL
ncbi:hypothetical protein DSO57_1033689 [Entomophthora muscae]|uniref:Uncharacterized protein n=1 Tax=Entomophthora muscae TaxID=34485 RepID=A0ACC2UAU4_9FUNG|nr:hypothetical protein DSO57_1033689 [Entomophthora muscae]